jgi:hypothetical protein
MTDLWRTDEKTFAIILASKILERPYGDPDDDLAVLSRQLLRALERESKLQEFDQTLRQLQDLALAHGREGLALDVTAMLKWLGKLTPAQARPADEGALAAQTARGGE